MITALPQQESGNDWDKEAVAIVRIDGPIAVEFMDRGEKEVNIKKANC